MRGPDHPDLFTAPTSRRCNRFDGDAFGTRGSADDVFQRNTFCAKVAALFTSRPGEWIDGRDLAQIAGLYGWRTRVSELRRPPFNLNIENRQYKQGRYTVSEYRLVVPATGGAA